MNNPGHHRLAVSCLNLLLQMESVHADELSELECARRTLRRQKEMLRRVFDNDFALKTADCKLAMN